MTSSSWPRYLLGAGLLVWVLTLMPVRPALAQTATEKQRASALHEQGKRLYRARNFPEAIVAFERAYEFDPHPALLFNIAQAHRHNRNPDKAIDYFTRYLGRSPKARDRAYVETRLRELNDEVARRAQGAMQTASSSAFGTPPAQAATPVPPPPPPPPQEPTEPDMTEALEPAAPADDERDTANGGHFRLVFHGGPAIPSFNGRGAPDSSGSVVFSGLLSLSYAVPVGFGAVDLGLAGGWSPIAQLRTGLSYFAAGLVTATTRFWIGNGVSLGPSLGLGMVWWEGLLRGNPFTADGRGAGSVPMPTVRVAVPATIRLGRFLIGLEAAFTLSRTTSLALEPSISSVSALSMNGLLGTDF